MLYITDKKYLLHSCEDILTCSWLVCLSHEDPWSILNLVWVNVREGQDTNFHLILQLTQDMWMDKFFHHHSVAIKKSKLK